MSRLSRAAAALLLPLSAVPVAVAAPRVLDAPEADLGDRTALAAPATVLTRAERDRFAPVRTGARGIPVLAYHGIADSADPYSITQRRFARHMAMLDAAGFESVSAEQYAKALDGRPVDLPERPILITFDDSRTNSFRGADEVLEQHGFRATMFAIADRAQTGSRAFLSWDELRDMSSSGRWDIQNHAGRGHRFVKSGPKTTGPAYANRVWSDGRLETRGAALRRITSDIEWGAKRLREEVPGSERWLFAVPFGDFGDGRSDGGNDRGLSRQVGKYLTRTYAATFLQREDPRPPGGGGGRSSHRVVFRHSIHHDTTAEQLYRRLCDCSTNTKEATR